MWAGSGSLPQGQGRCQPCRSASHSRARVKWEPGPRQCLKCDEWFSATRPTQRYCKPEHRKSKQRPLEKRPLRGAAWNRLRAQVIAEERDCWLCGAEVDKTLPWTDRMSASVDHVQPISLGGQALARWNCRLAHIKCNQKRYHREHRALVGAVQKSALG